MRHIMLLERRLQDLERRTENQFRQGEIVDVKFDDEKKRWYVKINDGPDLAPSGGDPLGDEETFKSDWIPWKSFAHGTIKVSMPPRKGMKAAVTSPNGEPELAYGEPYHYDPKNKSPHDKEDEIVLEVEDAEEGDQQAASGEKQKARIHVTKDTVTVVTGKATMTISKEEIFGKVGEAKVSIKEDAVRATHGQGKAIIKANGAKIAAGERFIAASTEKLVSNEPIVIGPDPIGD